MRLSHAVALHNIQYTCPPLATVLTNFYQAPSCLFATGGMELAFEEGTTQGCPLSMAMQALSVVPLISKCKSLQSSGDSFNTVQIWYAENVPAGGNLKMLRKFSNTQIQQEPAYDYFPKP